MAAAASPVLVTLGQLRPGSEAKPPVNIRATDPAAPDIATLAANIADRIKAGDRPLIEPLVVVEGPKPRGGARLYYVCNGGRRLAALTRLIGQGLVTEALELPVILEAKGAGLEASTTAAVTAAPHHPVEQFEAFAQVAADRPEAERIGFIARRFGLAERRVRQVLALGNLAPAVRAAWRAGQINQETAQAFAVEPDQAKQAELLASLSHRTGYLSPYEVRSALTRDRIRSTDIYVGFVGLQAYLDAGGTLTGDLFTEERYIADTVLLERLVSEKRKAITADLMAEGWGWVFWAGTPEAADYWQWPRDHRDAVWTPESKAELERLQAELAAIDASGQARLAAEDAEDDIHDEDGFPADDDDAEVYDDDEPGDASADTLAAQRQDLVIRIKRLKDGAERAAWSREEKANFAVIVGWRNLVGLWTGGGYTPPALQPPASGDAAASDAGEAADTPSANEPPAPPETAELPRAARQSLSLVANRAAAATLAGDAHLAMALLAAAWIIRSNRIAGTDVSYTSANQVPLIVSDQGLGHGPGISRSELKDAPKPTFAVLAAELIKAPRGLVQETLAKLVAGALDLTNDTLENRNTYAGAKHVSPAGAAAFLAALPGHVFEKNAQLILSQEADALFADWPKAALVAAVKEMDGEEAAAQAAKAKKGNLVALVAERAKATGWLPESLRLTSPAQAEGDVSQQLDGDAMDDGEAGDNEIGEAA
jgi:ParB family chromosome partitioning protein